MHCIYKELIIFNYCCVFCRALTKNEPAWRKYCSLERRLVRCLNCENFPCIALRESYIFHAARVPAQTNSVGYFCEGREQNHCLCLSIPIRPLRVYYSTSASTKIAEKFAEKEASVKRRTNTHSSSRVRAVNFLSQWFPSKWKKLKTRLAARFCVAAKWIGLLRFPVLPSRPSVSLAKAVLFFNSFFLRGGINWAK